MGQIARLLGITLLGRVTLLLVMLITGRPLHNRRLQSVFIARTNSGNPIRVRRGLAAPSSAVADGSWAISCIPGFRASCFSVAAGGISSVVEGRWRGASGAATLERALMAQVQTGLLWLRSLEHLPLKRGGALLLGSMMNPGPCYCYRPGGRGPVYHLRVRLRAARRQEYGWGSCARQGPGRI